MLFRSVYYMLESGGHRPRVGFVSILNIKAVFKKGLSADLQEAYSEVVPIELPNFPPSSDPLHPEWVAGFISGDGSFGLNYSRTKGDRLGYSCRPQFRISQDQRDLVLLYRIIAIIRCGSIVPPSVNRRVCNLVVNHLSTLAGPIVTFFDTSIIIGSKS
jgi:LAGLIDADG endonuclease